MAPEDQIAEILEQVGSESGVDVMLDTLFPFHLAVRLGGDPTIVGAGSALRRWVGSELIGQVFGDTFDILRPALSMLDRPSLAANGDTVFVLAAKEHFAQLRGQILLAGRDLALFIGSPVLTATTKVEELGLSMADFAPHDATVDLICCSASPRCNWPISRSRRLSSSRPSRPGIDSARARQRTR